jgi:hypothetical protein
VTGVFSWGDKECERVFQESNRLGPLETFLLKHFFTQQSKPVRGTGQFAPRRQLQDSSTRVLRIFRFRVFTYTRWSKHNDINTLYRYSREADVYSVLRSLLENDPELLSIPGCNGEGFNDVYASAILHRTSKYYIEGKSGRINLREVFWRDADTLTATHLAVANRKYQEGLHLRTLYNKAAKPLFW